jgi:hypothetical protein
MQKNRLALALVAGLWMAAPASAQSSTDASPLVPGAQVRGEITSADEVNWSDGTRSERFAVQLEEGQAIRFSVTGPLDAGLALFLDGELLARSSPYDGDATHLAVRVPRDGRYLLAVSGRDASSFGPFTLQSEQQQVYDGGGIAVGSTVTDWADEARTLPLRIDREGLYTVRVDSDEFDPVLELEGNGVALENDDANGSTNAMLTARLAPGVYQLTVDAMGRMGGQYVLGVSERELPAGVAPATPGELAPGRGVTALYEGEEVSYRLQVPTRQMVTLSMDSTEIDPVLALRGAGVDEVDDDSGDSLNARILAVLEPGEYTVEAGAAGRHGGVFTLSARMEPIPSDAGGGTLEVGQPRDARLLPGITDSYRVRVPRSGDYVIDMTAATFDAHLRLLRDGAEVVSDDDGGGALNARIEQPLQAGEYVIEARAVDGAGVYNIGIRRL